MSNNFEDDWSEHKVDSIDPQFQAETETDEAKAAASAVAAAVVADSKESRAAPVETPSVTVPEITGLANTEKEAEPLPTKKRAAPAEPNANAPSFRAKSKRPLSETKRAEQNRQAQKAFRVRKETYIKDLEAQARLLQATQEKVAELKKENDELRDYVLALQSKLVGVPNPPTSVAGAKAKLDAAEKE